MTMPPRPKRLVNGSTVRGGLTCTGPFPLTRGSFPSQNWGWAVLCPSHQLAWGMEGQEERAGCSPSEPRFHGWVAVCHDSHGCCFSSMGSKAMEPVPAQTPDQNNPLPTPTHGVPFLIHPETLCPPPLSQACHIFPACTPPPGSPQGLLHVSQHCWP